jgi:hypothetical protein
MYAHIERLAILHISKFICTLEEEVLNDGVSPDGGPAAFLQRCRGSASWL